MESGYGWRNRNMTIYDEEAFTYVLSLNDAEEG
jgi:hypothetical protein